jgi:phosphatidylglycerophosphate synthase
MKFSYFRYVLTPDNLVNFKNHKYDCRGKGIIEKHVDNFAREVVVPRLPTTLAPNLITLIGFVVHFIAAIFVILNDRGSFSYEVPESVSVMYIVALIFYGVMDSCDGAQARRTGTSSPMGELFDHGFDAITMSLVMASLCSLFRYSYFSLRLLITMVGGNLVFFSAHWNAYVVGYLKFGSVDAVEGQYMVCFLFLLNFLFGFDLFWFELPTPRAVENFLQRRMEVADVVFFSACIIGTVILLKVLIEVVSRKTSSTYAGQPTYSPIPQVSLYVLLAVVNYLLVSYFIFDYMPQFILINFSMPFIKLTWMVLLCYMGNSAVPIFDTGCIPPLILTCFLVLFKKKTTALFFATSSVFVFNMVAVLSVLDFAYFACSNIYVISRYMGIPVLTISGASYSQFVNPV